ncbi:MAG: hypothetical protein OdinLCB4_002185 [Candidatus Odinarchaeum yellowstonii]|uniref:Uncharacterized protein n=1 Tax=Odinarchaeota yellowstonii (strain LCB_4) TaxID=1841599 RepID=A0AAF0IBT6_ODILC|nr:MAG: hypothetical protein OdinLCB4_002185 [Candidatus Odinarchaeum yellowstonii]
MLYNIIKGNHKNLLKIPFYIKLKILTTYIGFSDSTKNSKNTPLLVYADSEKLTELNNFFTITHVSASKKCRVKVNVYDKKWVYYKIPLIPLILLAAFLTMIIQAVTINV